MNDEHARDTERVDEELTEWEIRDWALKALSALSKHWDSGKGCARNLGDSNSWSPTATCHSILALVECDVDLDTKKPKYFDSDLEDFNAVEDTVKKTAEDKLLGDAEWLKTILTVSSHSSFREEQEQQEEQEKQYVTELIIFSYVFQALWALRLDGNKFFRNGVSFAKERITKLINVRSTQYVNDLSKSPQMIWNLTRFYLLTTKHHKTLDELEKALERRLHQLMARRGIENDPAADVASLIYTLNAWGFTRGRERGLPYLQQDLPFVKNCVEAIVAGQRIDGTWPLDHVDQARGDGAPIHQASVELAVILARSVFHRGLLIKAEREELEILAIAEQALRRIARFLITTYVDGDRATGWPGWGSDRVRAAGVSTWTTALSARVFNNLYLIVRARQRADILRVFDHGGSLRLPPPGKKYEALQEIDAITEPIKWWNEDIIGHLNDLDNGGCTFLRPKEGATSFIIFGPPGSGKTYAVKELAQRLQWPLISLNPGHFISQGLELIEATASSLFSTLMKLDHAVVLFDECDELFRDRDCNNDVKGVGRNILSFATASMLPKLQDLSDAHRVIFVLATNHVSNLDSAIVREGRFDRIMLYDRPHTQGRMHFIRENMKGFEGQNKDKERARGRACEDACARMRGFSYVEMKKRIDHPKNARTLLNMREDALKADRRVNLEDYLEWCGTDGEDEIKRLRTGKAERESIKDRWQRIARSVDWTIDFEGKKLLRTEEGR